MVLGGSFLTMLYSTESEWVGGDGVHDQKEDPKPPGNLHLLAQKQCRYENYFSIIWKNRMEEMYHKMQAEFYD